MDRQTRLALELLRAAGDRPVRLTELKAAGIERPSTVVYELQLAGHPIDLLPGAVRLGFVPPPPPDPLAGRSRGRRRLAADRDGWLAAFLAAHRAKGRET
jgi:hypothetical protein